MMSFSHREKLMLAGLFLSKFDKEGLEHLGFSSFGEAYNAMGYALGGKPASIKNYIQEYDPFFPNRRKGWHKRAMRTHCRQIFELFGQLSLAGFSDLLSPLLLSLVKALPEGMEELAALDEGNLENETFSRRLITGAAAEGFFESSYSTIIDFEGHELTNVTRFGCGFDFRAQPVGSNRFLAIEVKGIAGSGGDIVMTHKEHQVADLLGDRYYLCVVRNFIEQPVISIFRNPLETGIDFRRLEQTRSAISWHARIPA